MTETNETIEPQEMPEPRRGQRVGTVKKPCPFCGAQQLSQNMARHIKARHQDGMEFVILGQDTEGKTLVQCPECGHPVKSDYIQLHRKRQHSVKSAIKGLTGRVKCKECGKQYARGYIGEHLRSEHGIYGGLTGVTRADMTKAGAGELVPVITPTPTPEPLTFEIAPIVVLLDNKGGIWHAERVR